MQTPAELHRFAEHCRDAVDGDRSREQIRAAMDDLFADPVALAATIPPFEPEEVETSAHGFRLGGEHIVYRSTDLTIMVLDTLPGVLQPPHEHRMVAMIGVFEGCEEQRFWTRTDTGIEAATGRLLEAGEIVTLGERAIHAISAPDHAPARAVHVYLGDITDVERSLFHPETLEEHRLTDDRYDEFCRRAG